VTRNVADEDRLVVEATPEGGRTSYRERHAHEVGLARPASYPFSRRERLTC